MLMKLISSNKEATEPRAPLGTVEVITLKVLRSLPWLGWPLWNNCVTNDNGYVPLVLSTSRSFPHSWLITGFVTTHNTTGATSGAGTAYPSGASEFTPCFSGVRVAQSLVLCVCFVERSLSFCTFSFGHCVICSSSIYGFWVPLWYL
jgi:hypothetical protein